MKRSIARNCILASIWQMLMCRIQAQYVPDPHILWRPPLGRNSQWLEHRKSMATKVLTPNLTIG
ncbi:hypothetical protein KP509_12G082100 [Ceratopteris richardii]|uniref:Secreted protein n=1 Tax=Ceratopteris richardii TaxID=49495 RepID=A0A8T2TKM1_CERRI|nr:hypothetical protein KP509_12G082100 [Ceratopteris richardii]